MKKTILKAVAACLCAAGSVNAATYSEVISWDTIVNGNGSTSHYAAVSDGESTYHLLALNDSPAITKVDSSGNATTLVNPITWAAASGSTSITGFQNFSVDGDYVLFADSSSDSVWSVNKNTGALTELAANADIMAYTGQTSTQLLTTGTAYSGDFYFYEGRSDSVLAVDSTGTISTYLSDSQLTSVAGTDSVSGGLTFDGSGNLIWASSSTDSMYIWDQGSASGSVLLDVSTITGLTGKTSAGFGDVMYAPDGLVYFYESTSDSILSFDPSDASSTLATVLSEADLLAGPAAYDNVFNLTWYDGDLAFNMMGSRGLYVVPEPMTLTMLGLGGLAAVRRKRA